MYARQLANSFMLWCKPRTNIAIKLHTLGKIQVQQSRQYYF